MAAVSRFVEFSVTAQTFVDASHHLGTAATLSKGSRGHSRGAGFASNTDMFTIVKNSNDQMAITINGVGAHTIVLTSGTDLDPRFVARDIEYQIHAADVDPAWRFAQCNWRNGSNGITPLGVNGRNSFIIYSGVLGAGAPNTVAVTSPGGFSALATLGWNTPAEATGEDFGTLGGNYAGDVSISGTYGGQFDDHYIAMISDNEVIMDAVANGSPTYNVSNITTGGLYHDSFGDVSPDDTLYTVAIDTSNGNSMGGGANNVPTFSWVSVPETDTDGGGPHELLYADYWYDIGSNGLRMKFADAVFGNNDQFDVQVSGAVMSNGAPGTATYIWDSYLGDSSKSIGIGPVTTSIGANLQLGTKGITIGFENTSAFTVGDTFEVNGRSPQVNGAVAQAANPAITQLNFGNVTVSTNSSVKAVWFEIIGGAVSMSTVKFSLQSDGTFQHHDQGDNDTKFLFGTAGGGNTAPGSSPPTSNDQVEFSVDGNAQGNILSTDIDNDTPPNFLFATAADLPVVASADLAVDIGNAQGGLVSDFIWLAITLGANETGANSTINYRMFFDFS